MARMAWGAGLATTAADGSVLDAWYRWLGWGEYGGDGCPVDEIEPQLGLRERPDEVRTVVVRPGASSTTSACGSSSAVAC